MASAHSVNTPQRPQVSKIHSSTKSASTTTGAKNPISVRLYKVLGNNYDDPELRDALLTVSDLYSNPNPESSKKAVAGREEVQEAEVDAIVKAKAAAKHVEVASGTAARARKSLRRDAELKLTQGSRQFVKAFQEVDKHLDVLQEHIDAMRVRCEEAQVQLRSTNESCRSLLESAGGLRSSRLSISEKQEAVTSFVAHFTLTESEAETLRSRDSQIDKEFFRIMRKAERIIADSRVLMSGDEGPTKAGVEIIAVTSQQLSEGYEKLARWCSLEFRQFVRDALLEVMPSMREAVRWLKNKSDLLSESLSTLSTTRQSTILKAFMDALTRGGPSGLPRPIEIHAHDPIRYVGDMLAWVHQAIAGEHEFLEGLFGVREDGRMVGSVRRFEGGEGEGDLVWIRELMDRAFEKLRYPLKMRVRQTVRSQESSIATYKVANLLSFYNLTMKRTIGEKAGLSETLNEITDEAYQVFFETLEAQARRLSRTLLPDDQDLQPPSSLLEHTQILRDLLQVYKSSLMGTESPDELQKGFQPILDLMVDAAVGMCLSVSDARSQRGEWDNDVFVLNCLTYLLGVIKPYPFAEYKAAELQADIDARAELLITDHFNSILEATSLSGPASICSEPQTSPLSHISSMQPSSLSTSLHQFSTWLSSPSVVHPPRLSPLIDRRLAERVHRAALRALVGTYECLCAEVRNPGNRYEAANTLLGGQRPFGSLAALRQILGVEELDDESGR